jgi:glycosyltransferase involved in cell wall biosynthesis
VAYTHAPTDPRVRRHCESVARRGWRVYQLGLAAAAERRVGRAGGVVLVRWTRRRYRGGARWRYALAYVGFILWARRVVRRLARSHAVGVVHVNNIPNSIIWAAGPARGRGAGVILDLHDPVPELFRSKFGGRAGAGALVALLKLEERWAARRADAVLCVHEPHRALTQAHGVPAARLRVVMNLADERLFPLGAPRPAGPFLVYHGTVASRMGFDVVLAAYAELRRRGVPFRAAIWGDGDAVPALQALRDELNLGGVLDIPGRRFALEELRDMLACAGLGVVPLRRDWFTDIMLPTKLLEYARLGIPAAVTWTPTVGHYFPEDSVAYLREFTPGGVANDLERILKDPEAARQRAVRAQQLPAAQAWQAREADLLNIVEEVENRGRAD